MKHSIRHIILCVLLWLSANVCVAQYANTAVPLSHYVFDSFQRGTVLMKSGEAFAQTLNYNILSGEMIFESNGKYLAIAEPQLVDTVFITGHSFIPQQQKFLEVLTHSATPLLLEFTYSIQDPGTSLGYGATSNSTAATALKNLISSGGAYALKLPDEFQVKPGVLYWILKDGRMQKAASSSQLAKIFPDKKKALNDWIATHHTDFSKRDDVITLVQQLTSPQ